ncbi:MAG TPA: C4-type zinc ribbon domain-containing protein [Bacteroidales bacterium]|nr:MAG: putative zinc ribbon domain protein [Bacteroidetes bacterium ADurb.Bin217]HPH16051.1 C4-type zinc ribbon domain-containing protein [Bacteroidales bacterium]HPM13022.1 C4-type zinc ribbon domain-containing protein [Bacteroidales bacterium]
MTSKKAETVQVTVEDKLKALFQLQEADSKIDRIQRLRGELPLEVKDLEDELEGLQTRIEKIQSEIIQRKEDIAAKKNDIKDSQNHIKKYEQQQMDVRNNREFEAIAKEIEFQKLEIELCEKRIREYSFDIENKTKLLETSQTRFEERSIDLQQKQNELNDIIAETQKEEEELIAASEKLASVIEDRLLSAYKRIRSNARNGLAVANVERDACGGCFNKIPPQRQLDIKTHKKIIVCEYCGRILLDAELIRSELENA